MDKKEDLVSRLVYLAMEHKDPVGALETSLYIVGVIAQLNNQRAAKPAASEAAPSKASSKPTRQSKRWTKAEKTLMMGLRASGLSVEQISRRISRTKAATQVAISKLEKQQGI
jgi:hypothetical protein